MKKICAIYAIINRKTNIRYVGSTVDLKQRFWRHKRLLDTNRHYNQWLQRSWNRHGESGFNFVQISILPENASLKDRQQAEIKEIAKGPCFNNRVAGPKFGNFVNSKETRKRISNSLRKKIATDPVFKETLSNLGRTSGAFLKTKEGKDFVGKMTKLRWQNPKERKRLRAGLDKWWSDPENKKKHGEKISAVRSAPEMRDHISKKSKEMWSDPEKRKRQLEGAKKRWLDPKRRAAQSARLKAAWARRKAQIAENKNT